MRELRWICQVGNCYDEKRPDLRVLSVAFPLAETLHGIPRSIGVGALTDRISRNSSDIVATIRETIEEFREPAAVGKLDEGEDIAVDEDFDLRTAA